MDESRYMTMKPEHLELLKKPGVLKRLMKNVRMSHAGILVEALRDKLLTVEEYTQDYKGKYLNEDWGGDSFMEYLNVVLNHRKNLTPKERAQGTVFVTHHLGMLADREAITKRFGIPIKSLEEMIEAQEQEK